MQIKGLHKNIYRLYRYARTQECLQRYRDMYEHEVKTWEKLKAEGVRETTCAQVCGISRATYYRRKKILHALSKGITPPSKKPRRVRKPVWGEAQQQLVLKIRRDNPTYGKAKIAVILKRDHGQTISESTVGRILTHLKNKGLVQKSPSALRTKRTRDFAKGHAKPWTFKKYEDMCMGERVQIDHMSVRVNGITVKHFQAWDRQSKHIYAGVYSRAKALCAKKFLLELRQNAPYTIASIQVDGGSEFMAEFEDACKELGIELIVLPPRRPEYNGGVERGNRTFREEFYARRDLLADTIGAMRYALSQAVNKYNTYRPHKNLKGLTPMQYIKNTTLEVAA